MDFNNRISNIGLYVEHPVAEEYTFVFKSTQTIFKLVYAGHKANLNKFQRIKIIQYMFSNYIWTEAGIQKQEIPKKSLYSVKNCAYLYIYKENGLINIP